MDSQRYAAVTGKTLRVEILADISLKELYEPHWEDLLQCCTEKRIGVKAIWMADMAHQGQSGMLNGSKLGDDCEQGICRVRSLVKR